MHWMPCPTGAPPAPVVLSFSQCVPTALLTRPRPRPRSNAAPPSAEKPGRRVQPLESLNPYTSSWSVRVRVSGKQAPRTIKTQRGETKVFSVDLTDEQACHPCPCLRSSGRCAPRLVCAVLFVWRRTDSFEPFPPFTLLPPRASPAAPPRGVRRRTSCSPSWRTARCVPVAGGRGAGEGDGRAAQNAN
jgi:hypothetical protein